MVIEPVTTGSSTSTVRPKPDADQARPDDHAKRDGKEKQSKKDRCPETQPTLNEQGQLTGKIIDIRA